MDDSVNKESRFSNLQRYILVILRFTVGWHLLYEGLSKLLDPSWSSVYFLKESIWVLSGFSRWIMANKQVLDVIDFLNSWGLTAIGSGLILGFCTRIASVSGAVLLMLYYLNRPPLPGLEYAMSSEGNNLIINQTLIEAICLVALAVLPSGRFFGLDKLFRENHRIIMGVR